MGGRTSPGELMRFIHEVALNHVSEECLTWPFGKNEKGYGQLWVEGKNGYAHRYICELAHGAPPTPEHQAAHSCGRGHDGCVSPAHLSWKTRAENQADRVEHGTHNRGERSAKAKLTEADARIILSLRGEVRQKELAERFGVSPANISDIHKGRTWAWLD